mmetsp:Transcript_34775/g.98984  ORF Transcript_34775/g.98984 Transcript_34775/m.98984 type:complete len:204 (-) Transcript_34775:707-1318(-)
MGFILFGCSIGSSGCSSSFSSSFFLRGSSLIFFSVSGLPSSFFSVTFSFSSLSSPNMSLLSSPPLVSIASAFSFFPSSSSSPNMSLSEPSSPSFSFFLSAPVSLAVSCSSPSALSSSFSFAFLLSGSSPAFSSSSSSSPSSRHRFRRASRQKTRFFNPKSSKVGWFGILDKRAVCQRLCSCCLSCSDKRRVVAPIPAPALMEV